MTYKSGWYDPPAILTDPSRKNGFFNPVFWFSDVFRGYKKRSMERNG